MGICYGMQLLVHELGGRVEQADVGEFGRSELHVLDPGVLLKETPREQTCWMSHRDTVFEAPPGFTALASSSASPVAAVEDRARRRRAALRVSRSLHPRPYQRTRPTIRFFPMLMPGPIRRFLRSRVERDSPVRAGKRTRILI